MNFLKDAYSKGTIDDEDVQNQITGTAFVMRQLEREDPTPEQEFILGKCWPFILAWHKKYDKNGVMYKSCQGKPPDGQCKMDHNHPELLQRHTPTQHDDVSGRGSSEKRRWKKQRKRKSQG